MSALGETARQFPLLRAPTAPAWYDAATQRWRELLVDHANCEKKAASTALSLMFTYAPDMALAERMSRLAREELRHFEQVQKYMRDLGVAFMRLSPSRYADGLRRCERFVGLAPRLSTPLGEFYGGLAHSESRHQSLYLRLAEQRAGELDWRARLDELASVEAELATSPDPEFRFHSGTPE